MSKSKRNQRKRTLGLLLICATGLCGWTGCVERVLRIESEPPGAKVFVNGLLAGETPLDYRFDFHGTFDIVARRHGHLSQRVTPTVEAPWYDVFPLDFVVEFLVPIPIHEVHEVDMKLERLPERYDPELLKTLRARADAERAASKSSAEKTDKTDSSDKVDSSDETDNSDEAPVEDDES